MNNTIMEKRLGNEPIGPLLTKLALPAIVGMGVNALYNIIDTYFISRGVGTLGIGGLTVAFPIQMLIASFAQMFGIGASSIISRRLGQGRKQEAARAAGNALFLSVGVGITITLIGFFSQKPLLRLFGATDQLLPYAGEYLSVILFGAVFISAAMTGNNIIRAEGRATVAMGAMLAGTLINLILDPIFIFYFDWGLRGAGLATIIGQAASSLWIAAFFLNGKSTLPIKLPHFRPRFAIIRETVLLGIPAFIRHAGGSLLAVFVLNGITRYGGGENAIAAFGLINRLIMLSIMPVLGIAQGFQPIVGFNYGAGKNERVIEAIRKGIGYATLLSTAFFIILQLFPHQLLGFFTQEPGLLQEGTSALRKISIFLFLLGLQVIGSSFFQALGKKLPSLILGMSRQLLLLIPLVLIMPLFFGLQGIWLAFGMADLGAATITAVWLVKEIKRDPQLRREERRFAVL